MNDEGVIDDNYDNKGLMDEFSTFKNIFNEMYLKDIRRKISSTFDYKAKTKILNPEPIIIEGGLPQIIDDETFNKAQDIRLERPKEKDKVYINPYPDMVRCRCCNKVMRYTYSQTMNQYFIPVEDVKLESTLMI